MLYYTPIDCLVISCGSPPSPSHSVIVHSRRRINELDGAVEDWERISRKKQKRWTQLWVYKQRATKRLGDFESGDSIVKDVRGFKCRNKSNRSGNMMLLNWNTESCHLSCCLKTTLYSKPLKTVWHATASFSGSNPCLSGLILGPAEFLQLPSLTPWPQVY